MDVSQKKTEVDIKSSGKTVGTYIYDTLLQKPDQKIKGKLIRTIERENYTNELSLILENQKNSILNYKIGNYIINV